MSKLVIYHAGCWDGFCAAWLMRRLWPDAAFVAANYGDDPPDATKKDVAIVDFSYGRSQLLQMQTLADSMLVLDHHKTAQAALDGLPFCTFDMEASGARLVQRHFGLPDNWLIDYTEDRDLWRWKLTQSEEINAALRSYPLEFSVWDELSHRDPVSLAPEGAAIRRDQRKTIDQHVRQAVEIALSGHRVLCVNATILISEIAGELAKDRPFGVVWFETGDNKRVFSLRSREGGIDVSEVAKAHGGGGHRNAAGFAVPATGATGTFSRGQLNDDDEGDFRMAIAADVRAGVVRVDFGKPVGWFALPRDQAIQWASAIANKANELPKTSVAPSCN